EASQQVKWSPRQTPESIIQGVSPLASQSPFLLPTTNQKGNNISTANTVRYTTSTKGEVSGAKRTKIGAKPKAVRPATSAAATHIFEFSFAIMILTANYN